MSHAPRVLGAILKEGKLHRRSLLGAIGTAAGTMLIPRSAGALVPERRIPYTIALVPGLTDDSFYQTMRHGAVAAARAVRSKLLFRGGPEWDVDQQATIVDEVVASRPDAILIAPTDRVRLIPALKRAYEAGIAIVTVDTFIGDGIY